MEAHKHICRNSAVGDDTANGGDPVEIPFPGIFAVHVFQDGIAPGLYRQVNGFADIGPTGDCFQGFIAHIFRM